jgi:SAM-dependent methyltransferase
MRTVSMRAMARELAETQAFFGPRAAAWDDKFPEDGPAYARAVAELAPPAGGVVVDAGCGTGRALIHLRGAVGASGTVVGVDATPEMLAAGRNRLGDGSLVLGDASALPLRDGAADAVLAAGLLPHLADPHAGLAELARVCAPGGRLAIFHPVSRASLAARHGSVPSDDDVLSGARLPALLAATGWQLVVLDDTDERYLALATRDGEPPPS